MDVVKIDFPDRDLYILKDGDWQGFRSRACAKEPETVEWIRSLPKLSGAHPQDVCLWDIGASVGSYSLIAASEAYLTYAFEPFAPSYGHLVQNLWLNRPLDGSSFALPIAFRGAGEEGWGDFYVSFTQPGSASHALTGERVSHVAQSMTVDAAAKIWVPPDHVKVDVDGGELGVIEGGRETWKHIDSMMIESEPPTIDDIRVILAGAGLTLSKSWKRMGDTKQRNYLFQRNP